MRNLRLLLCILTTIFVAAAAHAQNWTDWKPFSAGGQVAGFTRVAEVTEEGKSRHLCQFTMNENMSGDVYTKIRNVRCNDSPLKGWTNLGSGKGCASNYTFWYEDDSNQGRWDWDYSIANRTEEPPSPPEGSDG